MKRMEVQLTYPGITRHYMRVPPIVQCAIPDTSRSWVTPQETRDTQSTKATHAGIAMSRMKAVSMKDIQVHRIARHATLQTLPCNSAKMNHCSPMTTT